MTQRNWTHYSFVVGKPYNNLTHRLVSQCKHYVPDVKVYRTGSHGYMVEGWEEAVRKFSDRLAFMQEEF